jgi:hypothetical protein
MGMHLLEGRDFNWNDTPTSTPVVMAEYDQLFSSAVSAVQS